MIGKKETENSGKVNINGKEEHSKGKNNGKKKTGIIKFGMFCLLMSFILACMFFTMVGKIDKSDAAKKLMETGTSKTIRVGTILSTSDSDNVKTFKTWTINHNFNESQSRMWIWDYAAEDGDYVQVVVNGTPVSEPFMIKHKPVEFLIPSNAIVQIRGIHDGDGKGITYGIHFEVNDTTICNRTVPEGANTYTLVKKL